jgi:hypothetical protein
LARCAPRALFQRQLYGLLFRLKGEIHGGLKMPVILEFRTDVPLVA